MEQLPESNGEQRSQCLTINGKGRRQGIRKEDILEEIEKKIESPAVGKKFHHCLK